MVLLVWVVQGIINLLIIALIIRALLTWFSTDLRHPAVVFLDRITEPMLDPIRRRIGLAGPVDVSPMIAIFILVIIDRIFVYTVQSLV